MTPRPGPRDAPTALAAPAALSAGELIRQVDVSARMLMLDIDGRAAAAMVRTWPEVVEATADLWRALPREYPAIDNRDRLDVDRLQGLSRGLHLSMIRRHSHPAAAGDPRLGDIVDLLERAHVLVDRFRDEVDPVTSLAARADLSAAKVTLVHALYVGSHAVASSVQAHLDVVADLVRGPYQATQLAHGPQLLHRLRAFEQVTGSYVTGRYARTINGTAFDPPQGVERLDAALRTWDLIAHQTLASRPRAADARHIALGVSQLTDTTAIITTAARAPGLVDTADHDRLVANLTTAQRDWADVATRWTELGLLQPCANRSMLAADLEVKASLQQIVGTGPGWATASVIASRVDVAETMCVLSRALAAAADAGHLLTEMASTDQTLQAPAGIMNTRSAVEMRSSYDDQRAWVAVTDTPNRPVLLTPPARAGLVAANARAARATGAAATAAAGIGGRRDHLTAADERLVRIKGQEILARASTRRTPSMRGPTW